MPKFRITAEYIIRKEIEVEVPEGGDPMNPDDWGDIRSEDDTDCQLSEVVDYELWKD